MKTQRLYAQWNADASVTALVNTSGQVQERYLYDPYGSVTVTDASWNPRSGNQSSFGWRYLFQGGRLDTTTGWYDFRNRDLIPSEGRWAERDPLGFGAGDLNLYRDTFNSPETYTDPAGLGLGSVILTGQWNPPAYVWDAAMEGYGQGYAKAYNDSAEAGSYVLAAGSYVPGPVGWVASGTGIALGTVLNPNDPDPNAPLMAAVPGPKGRPIVIIGRPVPRGPMAQPVRPGPAIGPKPPFVARPTPGSPKPDTLRPGPHAGESIPARGPKSQCPKFTDEERAAINRIGNDTGCHTCGSKNPGTKSGDFIPDHQPPDQLNPQNLPQRLYPHCNSCRRLQGGQVNGALRRKP